MTTEQKSELNRQVVDLMGWKVRYESSPVNPRYTCAICSKDVPASVRRKAYKWSETEICIGSFLKDEKPPQFADFTRFNPCENKADAMAVLQKCLKELSNRCCALEMMEWESDGKVSLYCGPDCQASAPTLELAIVRFSIQLFTKDKK